MLRSCTVSSITTEPSSSSTLTSHYLSASPNLTLLLFSCIFLRFVRGKRVILLGHLTCSLLLYTLSQYIGCDIGRSLFKVCHSWFGRTEYHIVSLLAYIVAAPGGHGGDGRRGGRDTREREAAQTLPFSDPNISVRFTWNSLPYLPRAVLLPRHEHRRWRGSSSRKERVTS